MVTGVLDPAVANHVQLLRAEIAFGPDLGPSIDAFLRRLREHRPSTLELAHAVAEQHRLGPRFVRVLALAFEAPDATREEMARWLGIAEPTLKEYIKEILAHTGDDNLAGLRRRVCGSGLRPAIRR